MSQRRAYTLVVAALSIVAFCLVGTANAGKPTVEVIEIHETIADTFLTEECGVDVTTRIVGRLRLASSTEPKAPSLSTTSTSPSRPRRVTTLRGSATSARTMCG